MVRSRQWTSLFVSLVGGLLLATASGASAATPTPSPQLRLVAPRTHLVAHHFKGQPTFFDPGLFLAAVNGPFEIDARRPDYDHHIEAVQVMHGPAGTTKRALPSKLIHGLKGLAHFYRVQVFDSNGRLVKTGAYDFCPDGFDQRVSPDGPTSNSYPRMCFFSSPFALGAVWGIERGWAVSAFGFGGLQLPGRNGVYRVHIEIGKVYRQLFAVTDHGGAVLLHVTVKTDDGGGCKDVCSCGVICPHAFPNGADRQSAWMQGVPRRGPLGVAPSVATPSSNNLPDLVALPAWGIQTSHTAKRDYLDFSATVWNDGPAPLLVEGFRRPGQPTMRAFQYFMDGDTVVGRARVGELEYDDRPGHKHWHFKQFATYSLLDSAQHQVYVSHKEAFCLAPTDAIDMTAPGADWQPGSTGLSTACGDRSSIWTREVLPAGWGDTYVQSLPGQSLDITGLRNGTYYIRVVANPTGLLYERSRANNVELRQIVLGGKLGDRTVTVAPWHGITI